MYYNHENQADTFFERYWKKRYLIDWSVNKVSTWVMSLLLPNSQWFPQRNSFQTYRTFSIPYIIIHWTHYLFSDWPKAYSEFRNQCLGRHLAADYTIIMSRTLKVTGNHVMYDRGAWFLRVIMSSSRALCCLPSVKKQKHDFQVFFVDQAGHRKNSLRQRHTKHKKVDEGV